MNEMKEYPMTFREFISRFPDEKHCREYLYKLRFPNGFICPKCEYMENWKVEEQLYECRKCGRQTSVIAGTIFQDTRKPLMDWFIAIWWVTTQKQGASAEGLKQVLGLNSDQTAWTWLHKIRRAMVNPNRTKLSGTVEIDEAYIGGESTGKRGRGAENKVIIAVACELDDKKLGRCRMNVTADVSAESLHAFILKTLRKAVTLSLMIGAVSVELKPKVIHAKSIFRNIQTMKRRCCRMSILLCRCLNDGCLELIKAKFRLTIFKHILTNMFFVSTGANQRNADCCFTGFWSLLCVPKPSPTKI